MGKAHQMFFNKVQIATSSQQQKDPYLVFGWYKANVVNISVYLVLSPCSVTRCILHRQIPAHVFPFVLNSKHEMVKAMQSIRTNVNYPSCIFWLYVHEKLSLRQCWKHRLLKTWTGTKSLHPKSSRKPNTLREVKFRA